MNKMSLREKEQAVHAALDRVWGTGKSEALSRLTTLERFLDELMNYGVERVDQKSLSAAVSAAHRLSGLLGMFGMEEGSSCATEIEALLCHEIRPDVAVMARLVRRLREVMEDGPSLTKILGKDDS